MADVFNLLGDLGLHDQSGQTELAPVVVFEGKVMAVLAVRSQRPPVIRGGRP